MLSPLEKIMKYFCLKPGCDWHFELFCRVWMFSCGLLFLAFLLELSLSARYKKYKKNPGENFMVKFMRAIQHNKTDKAICLLNMNPQFMNIPFGKDKYTPFLIACYYGNTIAVKFMLRNNVNITAKTARGESAFFLAVFHLIKNWHSLDASCIRQLFYAGCNVNEKNNYGYTALHLAVHFQHESLMRWLLKKGADVNVLHQELPGLEETITDAPQFVNSLFAL